jgi:tetratricopeptide (TPR) repeat protein
LLNAALSFVKSLACGADMNLRALMAVLPLLACPVSAWAQHCQPKVKPGVSTCGNAQLALPDKLMEGLGTLRHPVSTRNERAQQFFDQGLTLHYAFNNEQAILSFRKAAELDPNLAMADWGIALAASTNINVSLDLESECAKMATQSLQRAQKKAQLPVTSQSDRDLIDALSKRYPNGRTQDDLQLSVDYALAMESVYKKYPGDPDVATLYADALMNLQPWRLWEACEPVLGTQKLVDALKSVLSQPKTADHLGANHFYIHAVEGSCQPGQAERSAEVLRKAKLFSAGHLIHMPSHIAMRTGRFELAAADNHAAVEADLKAYGEACDKNDVKKCLPLYVGHYLGHNLYFELAANQQLGRLETSLQLAAKTEKRTRNYVGNEPGLEHYMVSELVTQVRFRQWAQVLEVPSPEPTLLMAQTFWQWARAMALATTPGTLPKVPEQRQLYRAAFAKVPSTLNFRGLPARQRGRPAGRPSETGPGGASPALAGELGAVERSRVEAPLFGHWSARVSDMRSWCEFLQRAPHADSEKAPTSGWARWGSWRA